MDERISFPQTSLTELDKIRQDRMLDWLEDGVGLKQRFEITEAQYRQKSCKKCIQQNNQKIRGCIESNSIDILGNKKTYCGHLRRAVNQRLRIKIIQHFDFHPALVNKQLFFIKNKHKKDKALIDITN